MLLCPERSIGGQALRSLLVPRKVSVGRFRIGGDELVCSSSRLPSNECANGILHSRFTQHLWLRGLSSLRCDGRRCCESR